MILPNIRASFGRGEVSLLMGLLTDGDSGGGARFSDRLRDEGLDSILDDPRTLNAVLTSRSSVTPGLLFYLMVRHALLESGIEDRTLADYIAAVVQEFGRSDRAYKIHENDPDQFLYLVDLMAAMDTPDGRRQFLIRAHLGNFALWLSGIFPDYLSARVQRRGAPGIEYFEQMGASGYRLAADTRTASDHGMDDLLRTAADAFPELRVALNRISDRYLFPGSVGSVNRLLRQVSDAAGG